MSLLAHYWTISPRLRHAVRPLRGPETRPWEAGVDDPGMGRVRISGSLREVPGSEELLVLVHGLGGCTGSHYMLRGALAGSADAWAYAAKLALATLPAVVVGLTALDFVEEMFEMPWTAGAGLLFTGACLWTTRRTQPTARAPEPTWLQALLIGCAQVLAIAPGISRSGTTVATALALGVAPLAAAEFSFLMAIPAIVGAALLQALKAEPPSPELWRALGVGGAVACVAGIGALALFVRVLRAGTFHYFAWYTWAAGAAFLAWLAMR